MQGDLRWQPDLKYSGSVAAVLVTVDKLTPTERLASSGKVFSFTERWEVNSIVGCERSGGLWVQ